MNSIFNGVGAGDQSVGPVGGIMAQFAGTADEVSKSPSPRI